MKQFGPRAEIRDVSFISKYFRPGAVSLVRDLGGAYNLNLLIQAETRRYVLRVYRPWMTQTRLAQVHAVKNLLAQANFPVPLPLLTLNGEPFLRYNDRLIELEPYIHHDGEVDTWERNIIAFSLLGRLHTFLSAQTDKIPLENPVVSNYGTPETLLAWMQQAKEKSIQLDVPIETQEKREALLLYDEALQLLEPLREHWNRTKQYLPQHLTHGDYGRGNLLFEQERPVAILDFDFLRVRERIFEVAYTLYWWFRKLGPISTVDSWKRAGELLAAYDKETSMPLTLEERRALPFEMARVSLYWIAETQFFPNPAQEVVKHVEKVEDARWIVEHAGWVVDLFA